MRLAYVCMAVLLCVIPACIAGCVTQQGQAPAAPAPSPAAAAPAPATPAPGPAAAVMTTAPPPARPAGAVLEFSGPVTVTLDAENAVSAVDFGLRVPDGGNPVDMAGSTYDVTTQAGFWSADEHSPDVATAYTVVRQRNTLLEDGELLKVDLDTGALGTGSGAFTIEVRPVAGTPLYKTCTVPAGMAGGVFEC
jgi:hypothetical protein